MARKNNFLSVLKGYAEHLRGATETPVNIAPSEVSSERFHVELNLLPHPVVVGNGRVRFRLRAGIVAKIPPSDPAINDCLERSLRLAQFFDQAEGFLIVPGSPGRPAVYGIAYHTPLREDDTLFTDLAPSDETGYIYNESWLVEVEFNPDELSEGV